MAAKSSDWQQRKRVGIIGGNTASAADLKIAEAMGRLIAENGFILVNGGMRGVMEASARGAHSAKGLVIGILPGESAAETNPFTDIAIPTGLGYLRNALVVLNSDVLVAIAGEFGTLSEIAYAQIFRRTVFGLNTWTIKGVIPLASPEETMAHIKDHFDHP